MGANQFMEVFKPMVNDDIRKFDVQTGKNYVGIEKGIQEYKGT